MAYSTGLLRHQIDIYNRKQQTSGAFGIDTNGIEWEMTACGIWASVEWQKGKSALREGAIDAYGVVLVRMRWMFDINMRSRISYENQMYQILPETFHEDKYENTIQFLAQIIINENS